jgi:hypothetical protein
MNNNTLTILIVVGAAAGLYFYHQKKKQELVAKNPTVHQNPLARDNNSSPTNTAVDWVNAGIAVLNRLEQEAEGF